MMVLSKTPADSALTTVDICFWFSPDCFAVRVQMIVLSTYPWLLFCGLSRGFRDRGSGSSLLELCAHVCKGEKGWASSFSTGRHFPWTEIRPELLLLSSFRSRPGIGCDEPEFCIHLGHLEDKSGQHRGDAKSPCSSRLLNILCSLKDISISAGGHAVPKNLCNTNSSNLSRVVVVPLCVPSLDFTEDTIFFRAQPGPNLLELKLDSSSHLVTFGFCISRAYELFPVCEQCCLSHLLTLRCSGSNSERVDKRVW